MMSVVSEFVKECLKIRPYLNQYCDCTLPVCVWFAGGQHLMSAKDNFTQSLCHRAINVGPGLLISTCPGGVQYEDIKLTDFGSLSQVTAFIEQKGNELLDSVWLLDECENCIHRIIKECRGGCPGQKRFKRNKVVGRDELKQFLSNYKEPASVVESTRLLFGRVDSENEESVNRAIEKYEGQIKKDDGSLFPLYSLGRCYEAKRQYEKAIEIYERLFSKSKLKRMLKNRLNLISKLKNVESNPKDRIAWLDLEDVARRTGNYEESYIIHEKWGTGPIRK